MTLDLRDYGLDPDCTVCEDDCTTDGCSKLVALGPCSTILGGDGTVVLPSQMIFDVNTWCTVTKLNSVTYAPNRTIRKKGYVGECVEWTKQGRASPTIELDYDYCKHDAAHCMLQSDGCLVAFMLMDNRHDFKENIAASDQNCIRYGLARVETGGFSATFDEDDTRTATLHVHRYFWEFNICGEQSQGYVVSSSKSD